MQFWLLISILFTSNAYPMFKSNECINSNFVGTAERKGALFGVMDYKFKIQKDRCVIKLEYQDVLKSTWTG